MTLVAVTFAFSCLIKDMGLIALCTEQLNVPATSMSNAKEDLLKTSLEFDLCYTYEWVTKLRIEVY